ncbi:MAG: hypothetical protein AMJ54_10050 [Deltaproteobacteria bacterium SG8_13]|nr:MAG: hypothetical protein AMJ54_10050 [Deltaproteobacteria bacterium SG8_13]
MTDKRFRLKSCVHPRQSRLALNRLLIFSMVSVIGICMMALTPSASAGDFDGSKPLAGTTGKIIEINSYKIIDDIDPDTVGLPKHFLIDFGARTLRPSKDSRIRKSISFTSLVHIENKTILQGVDAGVDGVDDGLAWSLAISKKDGKAVLSASGDGVAYVVFATCTPVDDRR